MNRKSCDLCIKYQRVAAGNGAGAPRWSNTWACGMCPVSPPSGSALRWPCRYPLSPVERSYHSFPCSCYVSCYAAAGPGGAALPPHVLRASACANRHVRMPHRIPPHGYAIRIRHAPCPPCRHGWIRWIHVDVRPPRTRLRASSCYTTTRSLDPASDLCPVRTALYP